MTIAFTREGSNYRIVPLPNLHRIQLWVQPPNDKWKVAEERVLPKGFDPAEAVALMQQFILQDPPMAVYELDLALPLVSTPPAVSE
jgi:hypothetical protein